MGSYRVAKNDQIIEVDGKQIKLQILQRADGRYVGLECGEVKSAVGSQVHLGSLIGSDTITESSKLQHLINQIVDEVRSSYSSDECDRVRSLDDFLGLEELRSIGDGENWDFRLANRRLAYKAAFNVLKGDIFTMAGPD